MRCSALLILFLVGCYASHERPRGGTDGGPADAAAQSDLQFGVVWDHPDGRFREAFLARAPFPCELVSYTALDATGWLNDETLRPWLSLVEWRDGQSWFLHTETTNIGPGMGGFMIDEPLALGEATSVRFDIDVVTVGRVSGTARAIYCGVFALP